MSSKVPLGVVFATQDAPKTPQDASMTQPKRSKTPQDATKTQQYAPETPSKTAQDAPKAPQDASISIFGCPNGGNLGQKWHQKSFLSKKTRHMLGSTVAAAGALFSWFFGYMFNEIS